MYLPLHKLELPLGNIRRASYVLLMSILCHLVYWAARFLNASEVEYYAFVGGLACMLLSVTLAIPYIMLAVVFLLSPLPLYFCLDSPSLPMLHQWWFWLYVVVSTLVGIRLLVVAEKRYPKRNDQ